MKALQFIGKILAYILAALIIFFVIISIWLKGVSPGKTEQFKDEFGETIPGSVAEIDKVEINGIEQFILIRGKDINNPVLLMIHGGPGSPQAHLNCTFNKELEDHYIVVNWDQRGAGASYYDSINAQNLNANILIEDTKEVTNYLRNKFNKDKIFILGHSWGSYLGMRTIERYPELYYAYIGIGQVSNQALSEEISYDFVMNKAKETNNTKAIEQLESIGRPVNGLYPDMANAMRIERNWVTEFGGAAYGKKQKDLLGLFIWPLVNFKEYEVQDKINYLRGLVKTQQVLWETIFDEQLDQQVTKVNIPVYVLQGKYDYQTVYELAKNYIDSLDAPHKQFISFENSAHMLPYNNEIGKFHEIINHKIPNEVLLKSE